MFRLLILLALVLYVSPAAAQEADACPIIVQAAVNDTLQQCRDTGRDTVCFGHVAAEAEARGNTALTFGSLGDMADAAAVESLTLGAMSLDSGAWGMVLARISANMPDETVTLLLFGEVELKNTGLHVPLVTLAARVKSRAGANLRTHPAPDADLVAPLPLGSALVALGRTADGAWISVQMADDRAGWIAADWLVVDGNVNALAVTDAEKAAPSTTYGPLQAFTFRSGIFDTPCPSAPRSGVLVQTPAVERSIMLRANGVLLDVQPASTLFLQAQPEEMSVQVIEGAADIYAVNEVRAVTAGNKVRVPLDNFAPGETVPRLPEPYTYGDIRSLPVMALPREVVVPLSLGGVIIPAQPGVNPLTAVDPEDVCTVAAFTEARLRGGPGTTYPIVALIQAGDSARPDGYADDADGVLWWRLTPDFWIREDAVYAAGMCDALPVVEAPPPPVNP